MSQCISVTVSQCVFWLIFLLDIRERKEDAVINVATGGDFCFRLMREHMTQAISLTTTVMTLLAFKLAVYVSELWSFFSPTSLRAESQCTFKVTYIGQLRFGPYRQYTLGFRTRIKMQQVNVQSSQGGNEMTDKKTKKHHHHHHHHLPPPKIK